MTPPPARSRRRADVACCLVLVALALAWTGPALVGRTALGPEVELDTDAMFRTGPPPARALWDDAAPIVLDYPRDLQVARGVRAGRLDAWNPLVGCGAPLWAEQGGPFFPLKLPFYLSPTPEGYAAFLVLRIIAAAIGAYVLARRRGLAPPTALFAAALYELSGVQLATLPFGSVSALCTLPWVLLGAHLLVLERAVAAAALALGVAGHGGHPMFVFMTYLGFAAAVAGSAVRARSLRPLLLGGLAGAIGLLLAAPALLPFVELLSQGVSYKNADVGDLAWRSVLAKNRGALPIALYAPGLIEGIREHNKWMFALPFSPAVGVLGLCLGVAGILCGTLEAGLIAVLATGAVLALGPPPFESIIPAVPGLRALLPTYVWPLAILPLCQAAGGVLPLLGEARGRRRMLWALATVPVGIAMLFRLTDSTIPRVPIRLYLDAVLATTSGKLWLVLPALVAVGAILAFVGVPRLRARAAPVLAALALVEAFVLVARFARDPVSQVLRRPPAPQAAWLRERLGSAFRMHALPFRTARPNSETLFGLRDVRHNSALPIARYAAYLAAMRKPGFFYVEQTVDAAAGPLLDRASVAAVAVDRFAGAPVEVRGRSPAYEDRQVRIWEAPGARPRALVAARAVPMPAPAAVAAVLPVADADAVFVEPAGGAPAEALASEGEARIVDDGDPDRVVVRADLRRPGYVILTDTFYPGWRATVDGDPAPINPADLMFRAVRVPAGTHEIVFAYRPVSLRVGVYLFLGGAAVLVALRVTRSRPK